VKSLVVKILRAILHKFDSKLESMEDLFSSHHALVKEIENVVEELLKHYIIIEQTDSDIMFSESGHRFCLEINIYDKSAVIETFYLQRNSKIYKQYNKVKINAATISGVADESGQIYCYTGLSGIKHTTPTFVQSYLKFHYKAVSDYGAEVERQNGHL